MMIGTLASQGPRFYIAAMMHVECQRPQVIARKALAVPKKDNDRFSC